MKRVGAKAWVVLCLLAALMVGSGPGWAQGKQTGGVPKKVIELMVVSGVQSQIEASSKAYERQLKEGVPRQLLEDGGGVLDKAVKEALSPVRMGFFIGQAIARSLSTKEIEALLSWYNGPTGRKLVELDVASLALMRDETLLVKRGDEQAGRNSRARNDLVARVVTARREPQLMAAMAISVGKASITQIAGNDGGMPPELRDFFAKRIEDMRPQLEAQFEALGKARVAVGMSQASDGELQELARFSAGADVRRFQEAVFKGTEAGVLDALEQIVRAGKKYKAGPGAQRS